MSSTSQDIIIEHRGGVDWVTINRPKRMNSLSREALQYLTSYFDSLKRKLSVRVVVLRGSGKKAFSTGLDLKDAMLGSSKTTNENRTSAAYSAQLNWSGIVKIMREAPQPIIACLNGYVMGGGFGIALASDIRLATNSTKMNVQMLKIGLTGCDVGISYFLPRYAGLSIAAELMYTGKFINAERALRVGLVSEVFGSIEEMESAATAMANEMLQTNPLGLRLTKQGLRLSIDAPSLENSLAIEDRQQILVSLGSRGDFGNALQRFNKKKKNDKNNSKL